MGLLQRVLFTWLWPDMTHLPLGKASSLRVGRQDGDAWWAG